MSVYKSEILVRNMKRFMAMHDENQSDVARVLGVSRTTLSHWMNGDTIPRMDKIELLSKHWNCLKSDILEDRTTPKNAIPLNNMNIAPVFRSVPCGYPCVAQEDIVGYFPVEVPNPNECFWLITDGDSMINAGIQSGDKVLVRKQTVAQDGDIIVCRVNNEEATLKKFTRQKDVVILMPCNDRYAPIVVPMTEFENGSAEVIGKVIGLMRNF